VESPTLIAEMHADFDHLARIDRAREVMADQEVDALLLSVGSDLPYLIGYEAFPLERPTVLILPREGEAALLVPRLEEPRVTDRELPVTVRAWEETEDPVALAADLAGSPGRAAVGDQTWSRFLLGLQAALPSTEFLPASAVMTELRIRKDPVELELLRAAGAAADRVMARLAGERFSGRSEQDLARWISEALLEEGHDAAAFAIVASGPNGASPHHEPGGRIIEEGDAVVVDLGGTLGGYGSDTTRTFSVGKATGRFNEMFAVLRGAHRAAMDAVEPGVPAQEVDRVARTVISAAGHGEHFLHRTGHGVGLDPHEEPYLVEGNDRPLEAGMAFSVEPGIYLPGEFGMRIEDVVVVTDDGAERLNRSPRYLHVVG
jgi:Xaa-Pro aminopeptidase